MFDVPPKSRCNFMTPEIAFRSSLEPGFHYTSSTITARRPSLNRLWMPTSYLHAKREPVKHISQSRPRSQDGWNFGQAVDGDFDGNSGFLQVTRAFHDFTRLWKTIVVLDLLKRHLKHMLVKIGSFPQVSGFKEKQKVFENNVILRLNDNQWLSTFHLHPHSEVQFGTELLWHAICKIQYVKHVPRHGEGDTLSKIILLNPCCSFV